MPMTDDELSALVARHVMDRGNDTHDEMFAVLCSVGHKGVGWCAGYRCAGCGKTWPCGDKPAGPCVESWNAYATDIAAAWRVVEKMEADGFLFSLIPDIHGNGKCIAYFGHSGEKPGGWAGPTAPRAICLAALKAVGVPAGVEA